MPIAATWMDLEILLLREIKSDKEICGITYMWNQKNANELNFKTESHRHRKQTYTQQRGKGQREKLGIWD